MVTEFAVGVHSIGGTLLYDHVIVVVVVVVVAIVLVVLVGVGHRYRYHLWKTNVPDK